MPYKNLPARKTEAALSAAHDDMGTGSNADLNTKSGTSQMKRFAATSAPAALISYGLFLMMGGLIATEFVPAEASEVREISQIIPKDVEPEKISTWPKIQRLDALEAPPPPPRIPIKKVNVPLDAVNLGGQAPIKTVFIKVEPPVVAPVAISNRDATPIRPPIPSYPRRAIEQGIEGSCTVYLDVDVRGRPYNVKADCTDRIFEKEAERAVGRVEFSPMIVKGTARERKNVVYPLEFTLHNP